MAFTYLAGFNVDGWVGILTPNPISRLHVGPDGPANAAVASAQGVTITGTDAILSLLSEDDDTTVATSIGMGRFNAGTGALIDNWGISTWYDTGSTGSNLSDRLAINYGVGASQWGNSEFVSITREGKVGIGDIDPAGKFQVGSNTFSGANAVYSNDRVGIMNNGSLTSIVNASTYDDATHPDYGLVFIQGPTTASYNVWSISPDGPLKGDGISFIYAPQATNIHTTTPKVYFDGNGSVGIGTIAPGSKLHVNEATANTGVAIEIESASWNANLVLKNDSATWEILNDRTVTSGENGSLAFYRGGYRMMIQPDGNVGIGTTTINYPLTTYSDTAETTNEFVIVAGKAVGSNQFVGIGLSGYVAGNGAVKAGMILQRKGSYGIGDIHFLNNSTADNTDAVIGDSKMVIEDGGNVGIGYSTASQKLSVNGNIIIPQNSYLYFDNSAHYIRRGASNVEIQGYNGINLKTEGSDRVTITQAGDVGIGTTSPDEKLDVAGNAIIYGSLQVTNSFIDSIGDAGTSGQLLSSTGSGTQWINGGSGTGGSPGSLISPSTQNLSLGEGYASNIREYLYRNGFRVSPTDLSYYYALEFQNPTAPVPSIDLMPIGSKASSVFTLKPSRGVANFDFTRSTTATVISSDQIVDTLAINEARLDFLGRNSPLLLQEGASTNLFPYSNDFSNSQWSSQNITLTANAIISPDGLMNGSKFTEDTVDGNHGFYETLTVVSGDSYTISCFVKKLGRRYFGLQSWHSANRGNLALFDLDEGIVAFTDSNWSGYSVADAKIDSLANGWFKVSAVITTGGTASYIGVVSADSLWQYGNSYDNSYTGVATKGFYLYGMQYEKLEFVTSYIPTNGASLTRSAEICDDSGSVDFFNSSEGVLHCEIEALADDYVDKRISISDGTMTNYISVGYSRFSGNIIAEINAGGVLQTADWGATGVNKTILNKFTLSWSNSGMNFYMNGVLKQTSTMTSPTGLDVLSFSAGNGGLPFIGKTQRVKVYKESLTGSQLETLSSWSSFDQMATAQNYTIY